MGNNLETKGFLDIAVDFAGIERNVDPQGRNALKTRVMLGINPEIEDLMRDKYGIEYCIAVEAFRYRFTENLARLLADIEDLEKKA